MLLKYFLTPSLSGIDNTCAADPILKFQGIGPNSMSLGKFPCNFRDVKHKKADNVWFENYLHRNRFHVFRRPQSPYKSKFSTLG